MAKYIIKIEEEIVKELVAFIDSTWEDLQEANEDVGGIDWTPAKSFKELLKRKLTS